MSLARSSINLSHTLDVCVAVKRARLPRSKKKMDDDGLRLPRLRGHPKRIEPSLPLARERESQRVAQSVCVSKAMARRRYKPPLSIALFVLL